MTYSEILDKFKDSFPFVNVEDYRPVCHELFEDGKEGCTIWLDNGDMVECFREYLDFIGHEPEWDEEKQPFVMSYFHIVQRLFLWNTRHSGGNSTRTKCYELGIEDSSKHVEFYLWEDEEE